MEDYTTQQGTVLPESQQLLLHEFAAAGSILYSDERVPLRSGDSSHMYVSCREDFTDNPDILARVGMEIIQRVRAECRHQGIKKTPCFIGIPTAGTALAMAPSYAVTPAYGYRRDIAFRLMREARKAHGKHAGWVNGTSREDQFYFTVDDGLPSESLAAKLGRLDEDGYPVRDMPHIVFADCRDHDVETLRRQGRDVILVRGVLGADAPYEAGLRIGKAVRAHLRRHDIRKTPCLIGVSTGGTRLAGAASLAVPVDPSIRPQNLAFRIMREVWETRGERTGWVDGVLDNEKYIYVSVENVITSGGSLMMNLRRLHEDGYDVRNMLHVVLVDRQFGGVEALRKQGFKVIPIFKILDIAEFYRKLRFLDDVRLCEVRREVYLRNAA